MEGLGRSFRTASGWEIRLSSESGGTCRVKRDLTRPVAKLSFLSNLILLPK